MIITNIVHTAIPAVHILDLAEFENLDLTKKAITVQPLRLIIIRLIVIERSACFSRAYC
jgi:hypothetical protein